MCNKREQEKRWNEEKLMEIEMKKDEPFAKPTKNGTEIKISESKLNLIRRKK